MRKRCRAKFGARATTEMSEIFGGRLWAPKIQHEGLPFAGILNGQIRAAKVKFHSFVCV